MKDKLISNIKNSCFFLKKMWRFSKGGCLMQGLKSLLQIGSVYAAILFPKAIMDALGIEAFKKAFFLAGMFAAILFGTKIAGLWVEVYCKKETARFEEALAVELGEAAARIPYSELEMFSTREQYEMAGKCISRNSATKMVQSILDLISIVLTVSGILFIAAYLTWWLWMVLLVCVAVEAVCEAVRINYNYV